MEQICDGLAFAHGKGVVHRDIKPANIHIQPDGNVKIMDFGLARLGESEMTATGMILGTPHYMSPEQVRGEKADARSDVFSLGAVFYELLTHHKAFDADSMHSILFQVLEHQPEPLRRSRPTCPRASWRWSRRRWRRTPPDASRTAASCATPMRSIRRRCAPARTRRRRAWPAPPPRLRALAGTTSDDAPTMPPASRPAAASRSALARQLDPSGLRRRSTRGVRADGGEALGAPRRPGSRAAAARAPGRAGAFARAPWPSARP